jgi:hypothetical protein
MQHTNRRNTYVKQPLSGASAGILYVVAPAVGAATATDTCTATATAAVAAHMAHAKAVALSG